MIRSRTKELISPMLVRLATSDWLQTKLGPRTMAKFAGVILFSSVCSTIWSTGKKGMQWGKDDEEEGQDRRGGEGRKEGSRQGHRLFSLQCGCCTSDIKWTQTNQCVNATGYHTVDCRIQCKSAPVQIISPNVWPTGPSSTESCKLMKSHALIYCPCSTIHCLRSSPVWCNLRSNKPLQS